MNLVRCKKCGTVVLTEGTLQERLMDEREAILVRTKKLLSIETSYPKKSNTAKELRAERHSLEIKVSYVDKLLKQLNHQVSRNRQDRNESVIKIFAYELRKLGYTDQQFEEMTARAEMEYKKLTGQAQKEVERIYGEASDLLQNKSNADPTARQAVNRVKGEVGR